MRHRGAAWVAWWIVCWWAFQLLAGDWHRIEWIAGACLAAVAATLAEIARGLAGVELRSPGERLRHLPSALAMVFVDFGLLLAALPRRRPGTYVAREADPGAAAHPAATVLLASLSPDAYVVELDPGRSTVLLHDLVPHGPSERPA